MPLTREQIMERLQTDSVNVTTSWTALTGAVSERKIRYIVGIFIHGDGSATRTVDIAKLEEDGTTYTIKFNQVPVAPTDVRQIPASGYDIENAIFTCEGGTRPYARVSGNSINITIEYWDNDI